MNPGFHPGFIRFEPGRFEPGQPGLGRRMTDGASMALPAFRNYS